MPDAEAEQEHRYFTTGGVMEQKLIMRQIIGERLHQDEKWGKDRDLDAFLWMTILGEEFGEACKASLEGRWPDYRKELIQVAAVAVAAIECIDQD